MPILGRRRLLLVIFVAITLVLTFSHLAGYSSWRGLYPSASGPYGESPAIHAHIYSPKDLRKPVTECKPADLASQPLMWDEIPIQNPISSTIPLPTGTAPKLPKIQHDFSKIIESSFLRRKRKQRMAAVKEAFEHSWKGYKDNAWLHDEVTPMSAQPNDPFGGWGATLVDSLDTLWIMGLREEFEEAVEAVKRIDFTKSNLDSLNVFETTIRYLGGFLSSYDLTDGKYPSLLDKAVEVGEMLYRAFDTPNHMPIPRWNWKAYVKGNQQDAADSAVIAELGSLSMELTRLSQLTSDPKYYDAVARVTDVLQREQNRTYIPGLWPLGVNPRTENLHTDNSFTFGGMADSTYEYLPKQYILLAGRNDNYRTMHIQAIEAAKKYLIFEPLLPPPPPSPAFQAMVGTPLMSGTARSYERGERVNLEARGEHLTCFAGGMYALGAKAMSPFRSSAETDEDLDVARRLTHGCVWSYASTPTGIGPEIFYTHPCRKGRDAVTGGKETDWEYKRGNCDWDRQKWMAKVKGIPEDSEKWEEYVQTHVIPEGYTDVFDKKYILRPEAIESVFMMYRITGDSAWQNHAWAMFEHIVENCRTETAFAGLHSVTDTRERGGLQSDSMESFWTAETLKYFYLIFASEDLVSLDEYVFNTEAHPFRWRRASWFSG